MGFAHLKIRHMLTFIKRIYKYIYYNFLYKKKVYIRFNTNIDLISSFGIDCIVEEGGRVSASKLGNSVKIDQFAISKSSTLGNFVSLHKQAIIYRTKNSYPQCEYWKILFTWAGSTNWIGHTSY